MTNGNVIVNNGKKIILNRAFKATPDYTELSKFKVGYSNATPTTTSNDLDYPVPLTGTESVDDCETADWSDSADMTSSLNSTTFKEGSNALNLTKDGTASDTASTSKTTTSLDFTSKELMLWLYIKDATAYSKLTATDCLSIRFGNDSSNYFLYTRDKTDLAIGWNVIRFTSSTADSETGTVTLNACDYSYIAIVADAAATTWSAGDFIMDDWVLASSGDFVGSISGSYPIFDESNNDVEIRATLTTVQGNGYNINSFGLFNSDTTRLMGTESTYTADSKSDTDEIVYIAVIHII